MRDQQIIDVVTAYRDGKEIQAKKEGFDWYDTVPSWNFYDTVYRVKPEPPRPREWWAVVLSSGGYCGALCRSLAEAQKTDVAKNSFYEIIHVREVLP